jgi:tRNA threonylcarbamoyladenosine biosynthesis protein TsaE
MEFSSVCLADLNDIACELLKQHSGARIFAFYGKMGAGKTTFIKAICDNLNVKDASNSPSFGIINEYLTENNKTVYHFDFYRIKSASEFLDLGCEEHIYSGDYCFIEWPEKIEDFLPQEKVSVYITEQENKRIIRF